jgi:two-component system response regulator FixJ
MTARKHDAIVHVIDDDPNICRSLAMLLRVDGYDVRTFASANVFLDTIDQLPVGVVVADIRMPGIDGIELIGRLRAHDRSDPVIIMTGHGDVGLAVQALKAGATDFIEKPFEPPTIGAAIETALQSPVLRAYELLDRLTVRERQVFKELLGGGSNKRIAIALGISPRTVEIHRAHVMAKLAAESMSKLVRIGIATGLMDSALHDQPLGD